MILVEKCAIECVRRSEGKTSKNELTSRIVHSICTASIFKKWVVTVAQNQQGLN